MHPDHDTFIFALENKRKVLLRFFSKEDGATLTRRCAPMDFGPSRRARDKSDRYHFWDYDSDAARHTLSLLPGQIHSIQLLDDPFMPQEFVTWSVSASPWFYQRNWGAYS